VIALSALIEIRPEFAWSVIVRLMLEAPDEHALVNAEAGTLEEFLASSTFWS
jgi:hypothetical protein